MGREAVPLLVLAWLCSRQGCAAGARKHVQECTKDTFGMAGDSYSKPLEEAGTLESLHCDFKHTAAAEIDKFVLNYYPSTPDFANYNGVDMVPERHREYKKVRYKTNLKKWVPGVNGPTFQKRAIQLAECEIPQADGGAYTIQRIGPLVSTGNYDYWQLGWEDVWRLSDVLKRHPEGVMFTSSFAGPVEPNGKVLGHPPIHIHHIHISPKPGVVTKQGREGCFSGLDPQQCYVANLAVEQHGDYQCVEEDGGVDCFFERCGDGYAKLLTTPVDLEGEINDVRAPSSKPMTWWYQVVLRWHPRNVKWKPLSQMFMVGPGNAVWNDQRTNVLVFPVNTREQSVYWYSGMIGLDGSMVRNKMHAHNTMFDRAYYFRAHPYDLGLDDPQFWPDVASEPLLLKDLSFKDFDELQEYLFKNLETSIEDWDRLCPPSKPSCARGRPALTCHAWVSNLQFVDPRSGKSFAYDRRAPCCCHPQTFSADDVFTVVAFMQPLKTPPGPWMPDTIPDKANMHIHWLMTFDSLDNRSHYRNHIYSQNPDKTIAFPEDDLSRFPSWALMDGTMYGGSNSAINNKALSLLQRLTLSCAWLVVVSRGFLLEIIGGFMICLLLMAVTCLRLAASCRRQKRAEDHPVVMCAAQVPCATDTIVDVATQCVRHMEAVQHDE